MLSNLYSFLSSSYRISFYTQIFKESKILAYSENQVIFTSKRKKEEDVYLHYIRVSFHKSVMQLNLGEGIPVLRLKASSNTNFEHIPSLQTIANCTSLIVIAETK